MTDRLAVIDAEHRRLFADVMALAACKCRQDEAAIGVAFPHVTANGGGAWHTLPASLSAGYRPEGWSHGNWTCGFWVGVLVAAALATGDDDLLSKAQDRMLLVAPRAKDPNTHDIGFIFLGSALPLYQATGDVAYAEVALAAAELLRSRIVRTDSGSYIASWGPLSDRRGRVSSAIDTMANLQLLYWAAGYSGDASFTLAGEAHAVKTRDAFFRPDFSTYHAVEYEPRSGRRMRGYTFQGYGDETLWARGQGWAINGFAMTAGATGNVGYLESAERAAERYLSRLGEAVVPPWDFDDPDGAATPDSSTAAIVASALIEIGLLHPDAERGKRWLERGAAMLKYLCTHTVAYDDTRRGLLQHGCYSKPHKEGVDSAVMFGEYYFVEALSKLLYPGRFRAELKPIA